MCGISGIVKDGAKKYEGEIGLMNKALFHRGPDEQGTYFFGNCALGHDRLSIVDLSTGKQPMLSYDGKLGVVFNGEIYGYKDIKKNLGYPFKTTSDTEVILALYQKYGVEMPKQLPGMFAFALWDDKENKLFCARDRFGEKPFYYAIGKNGEFIFASEIKAIISTGLVNPTLDKDSLAYYLKNLYIHPYKTIYSNIFTLPPAHKLIYKNGKIFIERYWVQPEVSEKIELNDAIDQFKNLFDKAVEKQLVADVQVGAFLSGGLDSSTVVAVASKYTDKLKTFSFGFEDSVSELPYAREIAKKYNTDHVELFDNQDIGDLFLKMGEVYDEPFADSSNIPTYLISKLAREHLKVVLTGDGGDELLGGYGWYKPFLYAKGYNGSNQMKSDFLYFLSRVASRLPINNKSEISNYLRGSSYSKFDSILEARTSQNHVFNSAQIKNLGLDYKEINIKDFGWKANNTLDDVMKMDLDVYMPGDILVKVDRASMANSIELRAPFLDVDFASFCSSLPYSMKISKDEDKIIFRKAFSDLWTDSIRKRQKQGFGAPIVNWMNRDSVAKIKNEFLNDPKKRIFDIISYEGSRNYVNQNNYKPWSLLTLAIWAENNL